MCDYVVWFVQVSLGLWLDGIAVLLSITLTLSNILLSKVSGFG